ncbi:hypothetical protein BDP27DRAFT_1364520 [Rhodocollybia butyracea]|uniref:Uncharacterized protein n=1 Tax=Rhodocollybia butyracea TaxID=206335 RepID=A0A9P5PES4_9AGAR|nr:hypothetical protein BDP27DRAFT_1369113 [Rhodocollybia butyracea]KAF9067993.1 hypothetical protein BDP27DRAFT_1364520 [Rhodocollybia butyracea]
MQLVGSPIFLAIGSGLFFTLTPSTLSARLIGFQILARIECASRNISVSDSLSKYLLIFAPDANPTIVKESPVAIYTNLLPSQIPGVVEAYAHPLRIVFIIGVPVAGLALITAIVEHYAALQMVPLASHKSNTPAIVGGAIGATQVYPSWPNGIPPVLTISSAHPDIPLVPGDIWGEGLRFEVPKPGAAPRPGSPNEGTSGRWLNFWYIPAWTSCEAIVKPSSRLNDSAQVAAFRNLLWPKVEEANKTFILITSLDRPLPCVGKGTVASQVAIAFYEPEINSLYTIVDILLNESSFDDAEVSDRSTGNMGPDWNALLPNERDKKLGLQSVVEVRSISLFFTANAVFATAVAVPDIVATSWTRHSPI